MYDLPQYIFDITEPAEFWSRVSEYIDAEGNETFKRLAGFALKLLIIPHADASSERVWSMLGRQKKAKNVQVYNFLRSDRFCSLYNTYVINGRGFMQFE